MLRYMHKHKQLTQKNQLKRKHSLSITQCHSVSNQKFVPSIESLVSPQTQIQTGFTFLVLAYLCCPGKAAVKWVW